MPPRPDPIPELKRLAGAEVEQLIRGSHTEYVAARLRTDRSRVAGLRRGKLDRFSLETLIRFLDRLNRRLDVRRSAV